MHIFRTIIALISAFLASCSYSYQGQMKLPQVPTDLLPGGPKDIEPIRRDPRTIRPKKICRLVIGVGSGLYGFCTVDLNVDGRATVIFDDSEHKGEYIKAVSRRSLSGVTALLNSNTVKDGIDLDRRYSNPLNDGTQAFLYISDGIHSSFTFCNNTFPTKFRTVWHDVTALIKQQPFESWRFIQGADGFRTYQRIKP